MKYNFFNISSLSLSLQLLFQSFIDRDFFSNSEESRSTLPLRGIVTFESIAFHRFQRKNRDLSPWKPEIGKKIIRSRGERKHLRATHTGRIIRRNRGVEGRRRRRRISKLLGRTFSDACALPALPLSQIAINRQATRRRRNVPLSNVVAIQIEGVPKVAPQGSHEARCTSWRACGLRCLHALFPQPFRMFRFQIL